MTIWDLAVIFILFLIAVLITACVVAVIVYRRTGMNRESNPCTYNWVCTDDDPEKRGVYATYFCNPPRPDDVFVVDDGRIYHIDSVDTHSKYLECHELELSDVHRGDYAN